ncbi:MAG: O-antigen ligase family protein [Armatimonadetes bacterium]|nr:O-antigen ligase family protein [Armatimonadota bacterium]
MNPASASPSATERDLLGALHPPALGLAVLLSVAFGLAAMKTPLTIPLIWGVVGVGCLVAVLSPTLGFVLCVFLFGFRNDAFSLAGINPADPLFAVLTASWLSHALMRNRLRWHWTFIPLGLYLLASLLSGLKAILVPTFLLDVIRFVQLLLILVLGVQVMTTRREINLAVKAFLASGLVLAVCSCLGALDYFVLHGKGAPFVDEGGRFAFKSICVDPLRVSSFLSFPLFMVAAMQQMGRTRYERWVAAGLFWLGIAACVLSLSRSAVLQVIPGLLVLWWLTRHHLGKLLFVGGGVAAVLLAIAFMPMDSEFARANRLDRWAVAGKLAEGHSEPRVALWDASFQAFKSSPWIGVGMDNFPERYLEFRNPWLTYGWIYWSPKRPSHSAYIAQLAETGIVGTAAFLGLLAAFVVLGRRVVRQARADGDRGRYLLGAACLASFVGQMVAGIGLELFAHNHVWVIMVFMAVLDRWGEAQLAREPEPVPLPVAPAT